MLHLLVNLCRLQVEFAVWAKNTDQSVENMDVMCKFSTKGIGSVSVCAVMAMNSGSCVLIGCKWVYMCMFTCLALQIQPLCPCLHDFAFACECLTGCLGARRAGGALQGGLGEASGEGSNAGICQWGGREQLVPATDCGRQVQVLQEDLGHSHEALVVHTPIIPPHYYLQRHYEIGMSALHVRCITVILTNGQNLFI